MREAAWLVSTDEASISAAGIATRKLVCERRPPGQKNTTKPAAAPIVGATRPDHLAEAVEAIGLELTDEEVQELEAPYQQHGPSWY